MDGSILMHARESGLYQPTDKDLRDKHCFTGTSPVSDCMTSPALENRQVRETCMRAIGSEDRTVDISVVYVLSAFEYCAGSQSTFKTGAVVPST